MKSLKKILYLTLITMLLTSSSVFVMAANTTVYDTDGRSIEVLSNDVAASKNIEIFDITVSTGLSRYFDQFIVAECTIKESFAGTLYGKIYDKNNNLLDTVPFKQDEDFFVAQFYVNNITANYIIKLQILDENNMPISNEYVEEYSIYHRPIIKGYITDKCISDGLDECILIKVLTDSEEYSIYMLDERRVYINGDAYKSYEIEETYNAIQVDAANEVFLWLNDDNTVRVISNERPTVKTLTEKLDETFNVNISNATRNDKIIFACYDNKQLTYLKVCTYTDTPTLSFTPNKEYDKVKIMVWESMESCMPLCEAEEIKVTN